MRVTWERKKNNYEFVPERTAAYQQFMKTKSKLFRSRLFCAVALGIGSSFSLAVAAEDPAGPALTKASIPWSQIGAKAGADYQGDGLAVIATAGGARLRCVFQRLQGEATREGLWLTSTVPSANDRFRVTATEVGRVTPCAPDRSAGFQTGCVADFQIGDVTDVLSYAGLETRDTADLEVCATKLPSAGRVQVADKLVRFFRPGLTEEYSVSMDGVRQDFIIEQQPVGEGPLRVELDVAGAKIEPAAGGARLVLENSGRKMAYGQLRVTDATGKELTARMEVPSVGDEVTSLESKSEIRNRRSEFCPALVVVVNDWDAVYPIRIDPTFSDANWISMGGVPGVNGAVSAAVVDGSGNVYIGGDFSFVGGVFANHIAKWNGSSWAALGGGIDDEVSALVASGSDVYAGGGFGIAKWDGSIWSALGSGMNDHVNALAVSGSDVYAGGYFTMAGGTAVNYIAKWDGSSWTPMGSGMGRGYPYTVVAALAVSGSDVYAAGFFTTAGGNGATNIAKWDGSSWSALGSGIDAAPGGNPPYVLGLAVSGSDLYAGGYFTMAGGSAANGIAKWDGSSWSALGSGMVGDVNVNGYASVSALAVSGSNLYAGGYFSAADGIATIYIAKWNGSSWTALASGMNGPPADPFYVSALAVSGSDVYAGGNFSAAGGIGEANVAKWDGSTWTALDSGQGMNNAVYALAVSGSDLYAGGAFTTAGGTAASYIAKWNGSSWSALGSGIGGIIAGNYPFVSALAVSGSDLYAGGFFTTAGGNGASNIAKWDGSSWSALGSGMGAVNSYPIVSALAVSGSDLYAGGVFTTAGGNAATNIAKWDGSSWSALGTGISAPPYPYYGGRVDALAVSGSYLYAGGYFTTAGGSAANYIAQWDGSSWSALGSGMDDWVSVLAVSGSDLYAGGVFTMAGGSAANSVAKWDGFSWTALGSGMNADPYGDTPVVQGLAVSGSDLYAGGYFTMAGGSVANYIAKWDGSSWTALGSGMGGGGEFGTSVPALAVSGSDLYVGGNFSTAGGQVSAGIARAYLLTLPTLSVLRSGVPQGGIMVSWPSVDTASFTLEQAATLAPPATWVTNAASITDDGDNKSVTLPATNSPQFFRLRRP